MSKIKINDLLDETSFLNDANERFQQIEDEFNKKVLYRDNPPSEPNGMFNDLDMQENDILNGGNLDVKSIVLDGIPFNGAVNWGQIGGSIPDQTDLEARLQAAASSGVAGLEIANIELTSLGLEIVNDGNNNLSLQYTSAVNGGQTGTEPYGMVRLNARGKVDIDLLEANAITVLGFFRGDDLCPKNIDTAGIPGLPVVACGAPDSRNPSELYGDIFSSGQTYVVSFLAPEVDGNINLVDPANPLGPDVPTLVETGDLIMFFEEITIGGNPVVKAGWQIWKGAATVTTAQDTIYDPTGNLIIEPSDTNVDLALTKLDALAETTVDSDAKDVVLQNQIDINAIDIVNADAAISINAGNIATNTADIITNGVAIVANADAIQVNADAIALKQDKDAMAISGGPAGVTRYAYDSPTNTLTIFTTPL